MNVHVTQHAVERYQERVANVPDEEARAAMTSPAIVRAAEFGAPYVKLGTGHRIVITAGKVVTVLPPHTWPGSLARSEGNR